MQIICIPSCHVQKMPHQHNANLEHFDPLLEACKVLIQAKCQQKREAAGSHTLSQFSSSLGFQKCGHALNKMSSLRGNVRTFFWQIAPVLKLRGLHSLAQVYSSSLIVLEDFGT